MEAMTTRRTFGKWLMATSVMTACARLVRRRSTPPAGGPAGTATATEGAATRDHEVVVIGTGFGGTMTALTLARHFKGRKRGERVLMLERGAWWTTPVETVQDKRLRTLEFLRDDNKQPTRVWVSADHLRGLADVLLRYVKREPPRLLGSRTLPGAQPDGLFEVTRFGAFGGTQSDGITVFRANAVGGGSLVYANVTIEPPNSVFATWPVNWTASENAGGPRDRATWYDLARHAIGFGVHSAWDSWEKKNIPFKGKDLPAGPVNAGLSNIVTRSARLDPQWHVVADPSNPHRVLKQIDPAHTNPPADKMNDLWIDRARVFQTAAAKVLTKTGQPLDYGTVDSSINDLTPEGAPFGDDEPPHNYRHGATKKPINYCERQGRCMLGCLPGARHTLNKQLMRALWGKPPTPEEPNGTDIPDYIGPDFLRLEAFAEVQSITSLRDGGYEITYQQRDKDFPQRIANTTKVTSRSLIITAGCIGTTELLLRSKHEQGTLPALSDQVGAGFSINGDYLAFTGQTRETVNLTRGPMTTSFAHFNASDAGSAGRSRFHTIEDMGIPKPFSILFGVGARTLDDFTRTGLTPALLTKVVVGQLANLVDRVKKFVKLKLGLPAAQDMLQAEDIPARNMMCYAAMGRDAADGRIRLGGFGDTPLRVQRDSGEGFHQDPIYADIHATLDRFSQELGAPANRHESPFRMSVGSSGHAPILGVSHPLGGCRIAKDASGGVVDEFGRVFGYQRLYVADASIIPTSLGVNPSLTISALALRVADQIIRDHYIA